MNKPLANPIDNFNTLLSSKLKWYICETPFVPTEDAYDKVQDGSHQATQSENTFKYKSSHSENLIIGKKYSPEIKKIIIQTRTSYDGIGIW